MWILELAKVEDGGSSEHTFSDNCYDTASGCPRDKALPAVAKRHSFCTTSTQLFLIQGSKLFTAIHSYSQLFSFPRLFTAVPDSQLNIRISVRLCSTKHGPTRP